MTIEQQLDAVYERKADILKEIFTSETGIANPAMQAELEEITRTESFLVSRLEELHTSLQAERISLSENQSLKNTGMKKEQTKEEMALDEIQSVRNGNERRGKQLSKEEEKIDKYYQEEIDRGIWEHENCRPFDAQEHIEPELDDSYFEELDPQERDTLDEIDEIRDNQENDLDDRDLDNF